MQYLALVLNGQPVALYADQAQDILDALIEDNMEKAQAIMNGLQGIPPAPTE
mgnify:CR=1 FL=1